MNSSKYKGQSTSRSNFFPLDLEQRTHVDTASAAYHLGRKASDDAGVGVDGTGADPADGDQWQVELAGG